MYCDKLHKMQHRNQKVSSLYPNRDGEEIECYLCNEEIDKAFGYYHCPICKPKIDMCVDCAATRDRNEADLAENPMMMPTPFGDLN